MSITNFSRCVVFMLAAATAACAAPSDEQSATLPSANKGMAKPAISKADLRLSPGDLIEVTVYGAPEFERTDRVSATGNISLPMIGLVHVAGASVHETESQIADRLMQGKFFQNPQVSVSVKEYGTGGVSVLGEVQKPGVYDVMGTHDVLDLIARAGGTTSTASDTVTIIPQGDSDHPVVVSMQKETSGVASLQRPVEPGDTIVVSKAGLFYVLGDVKQPSGIVMGKNTKWTVLEAVAMVQGANSTADLNQSRLIRQSEQGREEIPVQLKQILDGHKPDLELRADDILYIPTSARKSATKRSLEAIIQAATGVAIYRPR